MHERPCCDRPRGTARVTRIGLRSAAWVIPSAVLAFSPKSPVCVAAFFTMLTGFGLSLGAAVPIQALLAVVCGSSIGYIAIESLLRIGK